MKKNNQWNEKTTFWYVVIVFGLGAIAVCSIPALMKLIIAGSL